MGQRANLLIVRGGSYEMYYTHWRANTLPTDLFWGPRWAEAFIRAQRRGEPGDWLDEVWAEGGAILDHDRSVLLLFGGEDVLYDVPLRRCLLELFAAVWRTWEVRWAHEGVADLVSYVGEDLASVLTDEPQSAVAPDGSTLAPPPERDWVSTIGSFASGRRTPSLFPLSSSGVLDFLRYGAALLPVAEGGGVPEVVWGEWTTSFPQGGFHVDEGRRVVEFWSAQDLPAAAQRVSACWPGWDVVWHRDLFEFQVERAGGALRLPAPNRSANRKAILRMLLRESRRSGVDTMHDLINGSFKSVGEIQYVNPDALRDAHLLISREARRQVLREAIRHLGEGRP